METEIEFNFVMHYYFLWLMDWCSGEVRKVNNLAHLPKATKYMDTITGHVVYKSLSNCCDTLHEFSWSYALRTVSPGAFAPVGMQRWRIGVLEKLWEKLTPNQVKSKSHSKKAIEFKPILTSHKPAMWDTGPIRWNIPCLSVPVRSTATY